MATLLGEGSYGLVIIRDGMAVKKFRKLSHLIQEYMALKYLDDCGNVVHTKGVDFANLELHMELYDCSLRKWLEETRQHSDVDQSDVMKILHDILVGLVELHDRELAHGDLKPGNVLIQKEPLRAVLGDCGFVSIAKYAKVERTAPIYRDPVISHDSTHDMFSFGICFLEMIAEIKINRQASYDELKDIVKEKITDPVYRKIIYNLVHEEKDRRPDARTTLFRLFKEDPPKWISSTINSSIESSKSSQMTPIGSKELISTKGLKVLPVIDTTYPLPKQKAPVQSTMYSLPKQSSRVVISILTDDRQYVRRLIKLTADEFGINRAKKGYGALLSFMDNHNINSDLYRIYAAVTLMILSSIFGKSGFRENNVIELCQNKYDKKFIYHILENLLSDSVFVGILLVPPF